MKTCMKVYVFLIIAISVLITLINAFAGTVDLPQTGQAKCYDSAGAEIACAGTGQDGEMRAGVSWPSPRFVITFCDASGLCTGQSSDCDGNASTDVVIDNLTGLMWIRNGNLPNGTITWYQAIDYANNLDFCGYTDWRLPNINELESLVNANEPNTGVWLNSQGFENVQSSGYWSSTTGALSADDAWRVGMRGGGVFSNVKDLNNYIWPVRSGQQNNPDPTYPANLWKTGQITSYYTGDDGDLESGVTWPNPRFTVSGDCVTDNLTGLMWAKDGNAGSMRWIQALDYTNNLLLCGYSDWRLPNRKELRSLIDYSKYTPPLPTSHPFTNLQLDYYWSSTTHAVDTRVAWYVGMLDGDVSDDFKDVNVSVWPVRGGQVGSFDYFCDDDGDGHIDSSIDGICTGSGCVPAGCQTAAGDDCNDGDANIHPGAIEICDGLDNDCDEYIDEDVTTNTYYRDADGDGYGNPAINTQTCTQPFGYVTNNTDCNDSNSLEHPNQTWYQDTDGDGYSNGVTDTTSCERPAGYKATSELTATSGDCNDNATAVNPGATEVCDGIDNNCDGQTDEGFTLYTYYRDTDGDSYGDPLQTTQACAQFPSYVTDNTDCDDNDPAVNPGQTEVRSNGKNDDCDPNTIDAPPTIIVDVNKGPDGKPAPIPVNRGVLGNNMLGAPRSGPLPNDGTWYSIDHIDGTGVWNPDSSPPGSVQQMINYAKQIGISFSRFPGGGGVNDYNWKHAVGPIAVGQVAQRPAIYFRDYGTLPIMNQPITFGIPEFLQNTEDIEAVPVIEISENIGTASDAADLVKYLNAPCDEQQGCTLNINDNICSTAYSSSNWPQVRVCDKKALGRNDLDNPWNVIWFEYGNETYLDQTWTDEQYITNYIEYRTAMTDVDDNIKLGAVLEYDPLTNLLTDGWNTEVIQGTGQVADFFITHVYVPWYDTNDGIAANELFEMGLAGTNVQLQSYFQKLNRLIYELTGRGNVPIAVTEFSGGLPMETPPYRHSLGNALINADLLRQLLHADNIVMANHWQFANEWTGMVAGRNKAEPNKPYYVRPNFYTFELYNNHFGDTLINAQVESDTYETNGGYMVEPAMGANQDEEFFDDALSNVSSWTISQPDGASATESSGILTVNFDGTTDVDYSHSKKTATLEPDTWYRLSGYIKTENLTSKEGVYLAVQSGDNLVFNPGFESDFTGWDVSISGATTSIDTVFHTGGKSAKVNFSGVKIDYYHTSQDNIPVTPGTSYLLAGYIKTETLNTDGQGVILEVQDARPQGWLYGAWQTTPQLKGTQNEWAYTSIQFTTNPDTEKVRVLLRRINYPDSSISGTAWWDDVRLYNGTESRKITGTTTGALDGWRYVEADFKSPSYTTSVDVLVKRNSGGGIISGIAKIKDVKLQKFTPGNYGAVPYLSVNASKKDNGKVYLMVVNKNMTADIAIFISLEDYITHQANFNPQTVQAWTLNDYSEDGDSTVDETNESLDDDHENDPVKVNYLNIGSQTNGFTFNFPKHSLTAIKIMDIVCTDNDGDGYYQEGGACGVIDCNDNDDDITSYTYYQDSEGDGYGNPARSIQSCSSTPPPGYVTNNKDCNDGDSKEYPGQTWFKDTDGDSYSSGEINITSCTRPAGYKAAAELIAISGDCNDDDPAINPATLWYPDFDEDGYGNPTVSLQQCTQPLGYILNNTDCNDNDVNIYPGGSPVRITRTSKYYSFLQAAYNDPETLDGDTIQSQAVTLIENPNINLNKSVTLTGGYDCGYSTVTGKTTVNGNMTINNGIVTIENFILQ